ncbi:hypothetical protein PIB30_088867 [Stylosanthes scabra]|uniref:Uncharacterized protein n=1 Tax=Stylosanthes scabra TaxID=79078 RepID=A0ABU6XUZ9_9FABA|nr:hypothetical protein [Stylosanthes scabra]
MNHRHALHSSTAITVGYCVHEQCHQHQEFLSCVSVWLKKGKEEALPSDLKAMEISYDLNRIQGVVLPACLCVGGRMPYFTRIARNQYGAIFGLVSSIVGLWIVNRHVSSWPA